MCKTCLTSLQKKKEAALLTTVKAMRGFMDNAIAAAGRYINVEINWALSFCVCPVPGRNPPVFPPPHLLMVSHSLQYLPEYPLAAQLLTLLPCPQLVIASSVRYEPLLLVEGVALPVCHKITVETSMDKVGYCLPTLLLASDSVSSVPPYFPLFLIQPYACVLYM